MKGTFLFIFTCTNIFWACILISPSYAQAPKRYSQEPVRLEGCEGLVQTGSSIGFGKYYNTTAYATITCRYPFSQYVAIGAGIGAGWADAVSRLYHFTTNPSPEATVYTVEDRDPNLLIPVFLHVKFNVTSEDSSKWLPYISLETGYMFNICYPKERLWGDIRWQRDRNAEGFGWMCIPAAGVEYRLKGKQRLSMQIGCHFQQHSYATGGSYDSYSGWVTKWLPSLDVRIGFAF